MPDNIDYKFLSVLDGGSKTLGYVPPAAGVNCGVAIATGFELGPRTETDLKALGLSVALVNKLQPYLGKMGREAAELIKAKPLIITADEAKSIDRAVKKPHVNALVNRYENCTHNTEKTKFFDLPAQAQTVIASVSFQYGVNLEAATPIFWQAVCSLDWHETVNSLKCFDDTFPTRRNQEAALLECILD